MSKTTKSVVYEADMWLSNDHRINETLYCYLARQKDGREVRISQFFADTQNMGLFDRFGFADIPGDVYRHNSIDRRESTGAMMKARAQAVSVRIAKVGVIY